MKEKKVKPKIPVTPQKAMSKAEAYCAYQERSQQEVRDKLYSWGLHQHEVEFILSQLISTGFLAEERFAISFAGGKFRIKKWGRTKIKMALKAKQVSEPLIRKALSEINERDYQKTLEEIIKAQGEKSNEKNSFKRNHKIATYAIGKGFEPELVWEILNDRSESD